MLPTLIPIGALLSGIALLLLGSGLVNTVIPLRGSLEGFSTNTLGLIGSTYFLGFFLGTFVAPRLIRRMGHIRAGMVDAYAMATAECSKTGCRQWEALAAQLKKLIEEDL